MHLSHGIMTDILPDILSVIIFMDSNNQTQIGLKFITVFLLIITS